MIKPERTPMQLRVGDIFQYLGGFGLYVSLAEPTVDPRTAERVLLFVRNIRSLGPVISMSLPSTMLCSVFDHCADLACESRSDLVRVRREHFEYFWPCNSEDTA